MFKGGVTKSSPLPQEEDDDLRYLRLFFLVAGNRYLYFTWVISSAK